VLVPSLTFVATANAVVYVGAEPVFVDSDPQSWTIDVGLVERELSHRASAGRRTAAVIAVDLYGQCCDYDSLQTVCDRYQVPLVSDAAESLGSTYRGRSAGSFGVAGVLSFNGNKILTTSGGGMLATDRDDIAARAAYLAGQAREPVPHYEHREVGYNYRLSNLLAALGCAQLLRLPDRVRARREIFSRYSAALMVPGLQLMPQPAYGKSNCWLTCLLVEPEVFGATPEQICMALAGAAIEARATWKPMHLQPVFRNCQVIGGAVAEGIFRRGVCLPSGSGLTEGQQARVVEAVLKVPAALAEARP
jgi:dTDP-4-amino-4,6-dideoxygalactose transaminase